MGTAVQGRRRETLIPTHWTLRGRWILRSRAYCECPRLIAFAVTMLDLLYPERICAVSIQSKHKVSALRIVYLLRWSAVAVYKKLIDGF